MSFAAMDPAALSAGIERLKATLVNVTQGTSSTNGLEDADVDEMATLERLREEATRACLKECEDHLVEFLRDVSRSTGPPPTYEEWITALHPENSKVVDGVTTLDHRFYVERSDHRRMWNRMQPDAQVDVREPPPAPAPEPEPAEPAAAAAPPAAQNDVAALQRQLFELQQLKQQLLHLNILRQQQQALAQQAFAQQNQLN